MKRLPLARQSRHKDTLTQAGESKAPAAGGMLPTHIPQDWLLHKFPGHLCPALLLGKL